MDIHGEICKHLRDSVCPVYTTKDAQRDSCALGVALGLENDHCDGHCDDASDLRRTTLNAFGGDCAAWLSAQLGCARWFAQLWLPMNDDDMFNAKAAWKVVCNFERTEGLEQLLKERWAHRPVISFPDTEVLRAECEFAVQRTGAALADALALGTDMPWLARESMAAAKVRAHRAVPTSTVAQCLKRADALKDVMAYAVTAGTAERYAAYVVAGVGDASDVHAALAAQKPEWIDAWAKVFFPRHARDDETEACIRYVGVKNEMRRCYEKFGLNILRFEDDGDYVQPMLVQHEATGIATDVLDELSYDEDTARWLPDELAACFERYQNLSARLARKGIVLLRDGRLRAADTGDTVLDAHDLCRTYVFRGIWIKSPGHQTCPPSP